MNNIDNKIIYIVLSQGRKFEAAFSKEEFADNFIELYSDESLSKEFWILNGFRQYKPPVGKDVYFVKTNKDGSNIETEIKPRDFYNVILIGHISFDNFENMITNIWAKDESEAECRADFIRKSIILKNQWGIEHDYK